MAASAAASALFEDIPSNVGIGALYKPLAAEPSLLAAAAEAEAPEAESGVEGEEGEG